MMQDNIKVGFCGVGNMAGAILKAALSSGVLVPEQIVAFDPTKSNLDRFSGINCANSNREVCEKCDLVFLGIKPQMLSDVSNEIDGALSGKCVVSILAGVSVAKLCEVLGDIYAIRVMPNTPMIVAKGCTAIARNDAVPQSLFDLVCSIFKASSEVVEVCENEINRIIPLSSSSPAFFFRLIRAMIDSGVKSGIDYETAKKLAISTMHGVSHLMEASDKSPDELIAQVTSPGGTTLAALTAFDEFEFEKMIDTAFERTVNRADELGK